MKTLPQLILTKTSNTPYGITDHNKFTTTYPGLLLCLRPSLIARLMGPTWSPSGAYRTQMGTMLDPWTLLSGLSMAGQVSVLSLGELNCQNTHFTAGSMGWAKPAWYTNKSSCTSSWQSNLENFVFKWNDRCRLISCIFTRYLIIFILWYSLSFSRITGPFEGSHWP